MSTQSPTYLPKNLWDKCKFCGNIRHKRNGNQPGSIPTCPKQGCPGQHLASGIALTQEERDALK